MARYSTPIHLPANVGDSVEFRMVRCNFCQHATTATTVAIERRVHGKDVKVRASLPLCCDALARLHHQAEEEISR